MKNIEELETFVMSDQPTTCVLCGRRVIELRVIQTKPYYVAQVKCPAENCGFEFISDDDPDVGCTNESCGEFDCSIENYKYCHIR